MNKTAIAKRIGGAALLCGLAVAAYFVLRPVWRWLFALIDTSAAGALSVVGVHAAPGAAACFMIWLLVLLGAASRLRFGK
jgi:hypothetical protein